MKAFSQVLPNVIQNPESRIEDEKKFSELVISNLSNVDHIFITGEGRGLLSSIEKQLKTFYVTNAQTISMMMDVLLGTAQDSGVRVLLSGFGGDEIVSSRAQGFFEELAKKKEWMNLKKELKLEIIGNKSKYYSSLLKIFLNARCPFIIKIMRYLDIIKDYRKVKFKRIPINNKMISKYHLKKRFLKLTGLPIDPDVKSNQYKRIMHRQLVDRIENSYHFALTNRIEYRYPYLDIKLIEFCYSLPTEFKRKNGYSRYIFRRSMEADLPNSICWRKDKGGASIPNSLHRFSYDFDKLDSIIRESNQQNKVHYVDYLKLSKLGSELIGFTKGQTPKYGPKTYINSIKILILQKWQREGKIDIGIKC
jgi:asparagine synthase (glutamine-hydrolysing)